MTDRKLMRQALEALTVYDGANGESKRKRVLIALRERLAQPEMQPCAGRNCGSTNPNLHSAECFEDYEKSTGMATQPVAWVSHSDSLLSWDKFYDHMEPLYTAPPQRKPLTDEEIVKMAEANLHAFSQYIDGGEAYYEGEIDFARAIEAAHGIKETNRG